MILVLKIWALTALVSLLAQMVLYDISNHSSKKERLLWWLTAPAWLIFIWLAIAYMATVRIVRLVRARSRLRKMAKDVAERLARANLEEALRPPQPPSVPLEAIPTQNGQPN